MNDVYIFVLGILVLAPLAKAVAHRISRGTPEAGDLKRQLQATEQRLHVTETRLMALEERVDFYEKLLSAPKVPSLAEPNDRGPGYVGAEDNR